MKSYTITVNGTAYEVTVEETGSTASAPVRPAANDAPQSKAAPTPAPAASDGAHPALPVLPPQTA